MELLCRKLYIEENLQHELKIALTHYSFAEENEATTKDGSRYVFLGQTAFKGEVAKVLFKYVSGKGTQLQHLLGNSFKNYQLEQLFDRYQLKQHIRYGRNFDWQKHKHIFAYALCGFVADVLEKEELDHFIYQNFLKNNAELKLLVEPNKKDYRNQLLALCKMYYDEKPEIKVVHGIENCNVQIVMGKRILSVTESKSYRYAQKQAWKKALSVILEEQESELLNNPDIVRREEERDAKKEAVRQKEKADKLEAYFEKHAKRSAEIKERKIRQKAIAAARDKKRRESKERAKERRELIAKQQRLKDMGLENISASKRRLLEDRGILPKKK